MFIFSDFRAKSTLIYPFLVFSIKTKELDFTAEAWS